MPFLFSFHLKMHSPQQSIEQMQLHLLDYFNLMCVQLEPIIRNSIKKSPEWCFSGVQKMSTTCDHQSVIKYIWSIKESEDVVDAINRFSEQSLFSSSLHMMVEYILNKTK